MSESEDKNKQMEDFEETAAAFKKQMEAAAGAKRKQELQERKNSARRAKAGAAAREAVHVRCRARVRSVSARARAAVVEGHHAHARLELLDVIAQQPAVAYVRHELLHQLVGIELVLLPRGQLQAARRKQGIELSGKVHIYTA